MNCEVDSSMKDMKTIGIPITLDVERKLVFNLNVFEACKAKYGKLDDVLKTANDFKATCWLAVQMLNEGAEMHNEENPDNKIPLIDEAKLRRYVIGLGGIVELQQKVQEAMLKGLPEDTAKEAVELGKKLVEENFKAQTAIKN